MKTLQDVYNRLQNTVELSKDECSALSKLLQTEQSSYVHRVVRVWRADGAKSYSNTVYSTDFAAVTKAAEDERFAHEELGYSRDKVVCKVETAVVTRPGLSYTGDKK